MFTVFFSYFVFIRKNRTMFCCFFFMRNWDEKYLLHVYCLLDIVIIFASRGGMSFFFCDVSNYLLYGTGMRKSISNISSDRLSEEQAKKNPNVWSLECFVYWFFFLMSYLFFFLRHFNNEHSTFKLAHKQHSMLPLKRNLFCSTHGIFCDSFNFKKT